MQDRLLNATTHPNSRLRTRHWNRGFALVVTLSLMILLTVIAVGLLSLSSIALRSTSGESNSSIARANARMALLIAIGELQKHAGSDQRVTGCADLLAPNSPNPMWTAVWNSRGREDQCFAIACRSSLLVKEPGAPVHFHAALFLESEAPSGDGSPFTKARILPG